MNRNVKYYLIRIFIILLLIETCYLIYANNRNNVPVSVSDEIKVLANQKTELNLLINDTDEDNDSLFIDSFEGPFSGILEKNKEGLQYIPNNEFYGVDSFRYKISDGKTLSNSSLVTLNVIKEVNVLFEAEKFNNEVNYKPFIVEHDDYASGSSYVTTPKELKSSWDSIPNEGCLSYNFSLERDSDIDIWLKVKSNRVSFWIVVDDEKPIECYFYSTESSWAWKNAGSVLNLSSGNHKLRIYRRRSGTTLDMVMLTNIEWSAIEVDNYVNEVN